MYFLPPFFIATTPQIWRRIAPTPDIFRAIEKSTHAISWIDFFKASCKSADVFGGEIHNTPISLLPKNIT